jgi:hypothetical protein
MNDPKGLGSCSYEKIRPSNNFTARSSLLFDRSPVKSPRVKKVGGHCKLTSQPGLGG